MKRRLFLEGLLAVPAVTYFFMGPSWAKNRAGILVLEDPLCPADRAYFIEDESLLIIKKYYNDQVVRSLTYEGEPFRSLTLPRSGYYP